MSIQFRTILNIMNDYRDIEDIAYSLHSEEIIGLKLDIKRACNALNIRTNKISLSQAKRIERYLNDACKLQ